MVPFLRPMMWIAILHIAIHFGAPALGQNAGDTAAQAVTEVKTVDPKPLVPPLINVSAQIAKRNTIITTLAVVFSLCFLQTLAYLGVIGEPNEGLASYLYQRRHAIKSKTLNLISNGVKSGANSYRTWDDKAKFAWAVTIGDFGIGPFAKVLKVTTIVFTISVLVGEALALTGILGGRREHVAKWLKEEKIPERIRMFLSFSRLQLWDALKLDSKKVASFLKLVKRDSIFWTGCIIGAIAGVFFNARRCNVV